MSARRPRGSVVVVAVLLPVVLGVIGLAALSDRFASLDRVPAAVVNLDQMVTTGEGEDQQVIFAGRLLAAGLTSPADEASSSLGWSLSDAETAAAGLADGTYYAVLTIPEDFSAALAEIGGDAPRQAVVEVRSNDASSEVVGMVSDQVAAVAAAQLGTMVTTTFVEGVYGGFGDMAEQLTQAADGAAQVTDGVHRVDDGARRLDDGVASLADGLGELSAGAGALASGVGQVSSGTATFAAGIGDLADGAGQVDAGAAALADGAGQLATGTAALATGTQDLATGADQLATGLETFAAQTQTLPVDTEALAAGIGQLADGLALMSGQLAGLPDGDELVEQITGGVAELSAGLSALVANCAATGATPEFCAQLAEAAAAAGEWYEQVGGDEAVLPVLIESAAALVDGIGSASDGAAELATGAQQLADGIPALVGGITSAADGARALADGAAGVAGGAADLAAGTTDLATGAGQLATGTSALASGAAEASTGATALADGARQVSAGSQELAAGAAAASGGAALLADGSGAFAAGVGELATGADLLADGLRDGAEAVPTYTDAEAAAIAEVVAAPVVSRADRLNPSAGGATTIAPFVVLLALWLGTLAVATLRPPLPPSVVSSAEPARRAAARGAWPAVLLALVQAVAVAAALPLFGVSHASPVAALALTLLAAAAFAVVNLAIVAAVGTRAGWMASLVLLVLQAASVGALVPIETAPPVFRTLAGVLPLPLAADGLTRLTMGGTVGSLGTAVAGLLAWAAVAFAALVWTARRRQRVTVGQLRAALAT